MLMKMMDEEIGSSTAPTDSSELDADPGEDTFVEE